VSYGWPGVKANVVTPVSLHASLVLLLVLGAGGCAQVAISTSAGAQRAARAPVDVQIDQCIDRTETPGRNLGLEATQAFEEKLRATKEFVLAKDARYRLACEVSGFVEGSAIKRWVLPGWGATVGRVSAMLTDTRTGEIAIIAEGDATVSAGGLYTIGAETYIVNAAVDSAVEQLCGWARGGSPEGERRRGETIERGNHQ